MQSIRMNLPAMLASSSQELQSIAKEFQEAVKTGQLEEYDSFARKSLLQLSRLIPKEQHWSEALFPRRYSAISDTPVPVGDEKSIAGQLSGFPSSKIWYFVEQFNILDEEMKKVVNVMYPVNRFVACIPTVAMSSFASLVCMLVLQKKYRSGFVCKIWRFQIFWRILTT